MGKAPELCQKALEAKIELYTKVFNKKYTDEGLRADIDDIRSEIGLIISEALLSYDECAQRRASVKTFIDGAVKKRMTNYRQRRLLKDEAFQTVSLDCNMRLVDAQHYVMPDTSKLVIGDLLGAFVGVDKLLVAEQIMPSAKVWRVFRAIDDMAAGGKWENSGVIGRMVFAIAKVYGLGPRAVLRRNKKNEGKVKKRLTLSHY